MKFIKIDFGINNSGFIVDSAFSISTSNSDLHLKLMNASKEALNNAIKKVRPDVRIYDIGVETQEIIESYEFNPVKDLCGHQILPFKIHAKKVIPNIKFPFLKDYNNDLYKISENEIYAIEPFVSNKSGNIYSSSDISHYCLNYNLSIDKKNRIINDLLFKENKKTVDLYDYLYNRFKTLPFCDNWIYNINQNDDFKFYFENKSISQEQIWKCLIF